MAYNESGFGGSTQQQASAHPIILQASGETVTLPHEYNLRDADLLRSAMDLQLSVDGHTLTIENYFAFDPAPALQSTDGFSLSPQLVSSFVKASPDYAAAGSLVDESPVGVVEEVMGGATVTRVDGSTETVRLGIEIYQGDIVETAGDGAVNIVFVDDTSFAVSEDARLAIDEYVYDPVTESGSTDFSVLKGVFVYTSGAIGRDDPDDVTIDTPVGSIGIRGTIIAGDVNHGEITVVEGAIVLRDLGGHEVTLANQFETARFDGSGQGIEHMGQLAANDVVQKFSSISNVAPDLFSSMNDAAHENGGDEAGQQQPKGQDGQEDGAQTAGDQSDDQGDGEQGADDGQHHEDAAGGEDGAADQGADQPAGEEGATASDAQPDNAADSSEKPALQQGDQVKMALAQERGQLAENAHERAEKIVQAKRAQLLKALAEQKAAADSATQQQTNTQAEQAQTDSVDPVSYQQETSDNHAPRLVGEKFLPPASFFHVAENTGTLEFFFDQVFYDIDGDHIAYRLSEDTVKLLNSLAENDNGQGLLETGGAVETGWEFNQETGKLTLYINDDFAEYVQSLELSVVASDGEDVSHYRFVLTAFDFDATPTINGVTYEVVTISHGAAVSDHQIAFVEDAVGAEITVSGDNSEVHLGEGGQHVTVGTGADDNTIIGGNAPDSDDYFLVYGADNNMYGMDGSDTFKVMLDDVAIDDAASNASGVIHEWDGGWNDTTTAQKMALELKNGTFDAGRYTSVDLETGDTLKLYNAEGGDTANGVVDFSEIDVLIKNIENIELAGDETVSLKLNVEDVVKITDQHNTLTIMGRDNDQVQLSGFHEVDVNQDGKIGAADQINVNGENYTVYVGTGDDGQQVTLIVDADVNVTNPV